MAEAHGQLTGRPAVCLGTRAVGSSNLAIGIHTARQDSSPMFAHRRPGRTRPSGPRGVPGDRPGREHRQAGASGPPNLPMPRPSPPAMAEAIRRRPVRAPGSGPHLAGRGPARRARARRRARRWRTARRRPPVRRRYPRRRSSCSLPPGVRSSWLVLASCGRGPRPTCCASPNSCPSRSSRPGVVPTSSRTTTRCTSGWPASVRRRSSVSDSSSPMRCS